MLAVLLTERGLGGDGADLERRLMRFRDGKIAARHGGAAAGGAAGAATLPLGGGSAQAPGGGGAERSATPPPRSATRSTLPSRGRVTRGALLIHAWPDRVAKARGERGRFVLANGRGAMLDAADPLAGEAFLVVADLQGKAQNARIAAAAAVDEDDIRAALADQHRDAARETALRPRKARRARARDRPPRRHRSVRAHAAGASRRRCRPRHPRRLARARPVAAAVEQGRRRRCASASPGCIAASARPGPTFPTRRWSSASTTGCCRSFPARPRFAAIDPGALLDPA